MQQLMLAVSRWVAQQRALVCCHLNLQCTMSGQVALAHLMAPLLHRSPRPAALQPYQLDPNVWAHKPAWCQPWSILATGSAVVAGVWAVSGGSSGWTAAATVPVAAWWWLFLGIYPQQFKEYAEGLNAQQRQLIQQRQQQLEEQRRRRQEQSD